MQHSTHPMMPPLLSMVMYTLKSAAVPLRSKCFMLPFSEEKMSSGYLPSGSTCSHQQKMPGALSLLLCSQ